MRRFVGFLVSLESLAMVAALVVGVDAPGQADVPQRRGKTVDRLTGVIASSSDPSGVASPAAPNPNPNAFVACQNTAGHPHRPPFCRARTWVVTGGGPTTGESSRLAAALGLPEVPLAPDGALRWLDEAHFQFVPTRASTPEPGDELDEDGQPTAVEALDVPALAQVPILSDDKALRRANRALRRAGLLPAGAHGEIGHSMLELVGTGDPSSTLPAMSVPLDTHVSYHLTLGGLRLVGPGAKVKLVFDGAGRTTQLYYALRRVAPGPDVAIMPPAEAENACAKAYRLSPGGEPQRTHQQAQILRVTAELVYFAPPPSLPVRALYPHFLCSGRIPGEESAEDVLLRELVIPAVLDVPAVQVTASFDGLQVTAEAQVTGGTPPFTFQWSAETTTLDPDDATAGPILNYAPAPRSFEFDDEVSVVVTDANALTGSRRRPGRMSQARNGPRAINR